MIHRVPVPLILIVLMCSTLACGAPASPEPTVSAPVATVAPTAGSESSGMLQPVYVESGDGRVLHMLPLPLHASACRMLTCAVGRECILRPGLPPVATCGAH